MAVWRLADRGIELNRPLAVGIVNVTDDSFFAGARSGTPERAVERGLELVDQGFDLLDVGAVPARSGPPVPADEEAARLIPAVEALAERSGVPVMADTFSPEIAERALDAGAVAINDTSGGLHPGMFALVGDRGCGYVLMHTEGEPRQDRPLRRYEDPVDHLRRWFRFRIDAALVRGVELEQIAIDPGLDFDLSVDADIEILRRLGELRELGRPLFLALSRKDFLGALVTGSWDERADPEEREWATVAATALAVAGGADMVRLHDRTSLDALRVAGRIAHG
jgi:dihydropteroate synthase